MVACILAGGEGKRLSPLTAHRAKPAVRFGGSYRLIDFSLSNCINSQIRKILVFTQYKALSLERHLRQGWSFLSAPPDEYVLSLPPRQHVGFGRYRGTADALYQNLSTLERIEPSAVLILGGDHVYYMNYRYLLDLHQECQADVTVATFPVPSQQACQFGILSVDRFGTVTSFEEKPTAVSVPFPGGSPVLASMGIYVFTFEILRKVLLEDSHERSTHDFGRDILPSMLGRYRMAAFPFVQQMGKEPAYWRDVGTIDAYWEAHMDLLGPHPHLHLEHAQWPLHTAHTPRPSTAFLAPGDVRSSGEGRVINSLIAQGCMLQGGRVERSVLSPRVCVEPGAEVEESILLDDVSVGRQARVRRAILDRGTVVPPGACIGYDRATDAQRFTVSAAGITVVGHAELGGCSDRKQARDPSTRSETPSKSTLKRLQVLHRNASAPC